MDMSKVESIVYEADATRYEILVSFINNKDSNYDQQYVVTLVNFGECYFDTELRFISSAILSKSKTLGGLDAKNIHNALAERFPSELDEVEFDQLSRVLVPAKAV